MSIPVVPGTTGSVGSPQRNVGVAQSPRTLTQPQEMKIVQDILDCINEMKSDFEESKIPIDDDNQQLQRFCAKLEYLFQSNMKEKKNLLGRKKDYWDYFCNCLGKTKGISDGIRFVKSVSEYKTSLGKGRAFLRFCLVHNRMADSLQACIINGKTTSEWFYPESIWLHQDRNSVLISALYDLSGLQFDLASSGYDLDNAWPSFAKKSLGSHHTWNMPSRTSSMSSLISIPGQDASLHRFNLSTTPIDTDDVIHMSPGSHISERMPSCLTENTEAHKQELEVLQQQLNEVKDKNQQITKEHEDLKQRYDRLVLDQESKQTEWEMKYTLKTDEVDKVNKQIMSLDNQLQNQREAHSKQESENIKMQFEVSSLQQNAASVKDQNDAMEAEMSVLRDKLTKQEEKNQDLLNKIESLLQEKNDEAKTQRSSVDKLQETYELVKGLESENMTLKNENKELNEKCGKLQSNMDEIEQSRISLENILENNKKELQEMQNKLSKMDIQKQTLESQGQSLNREIASLKEFYETEKGDTEKVKGKFEEKVELVKNLELQIDEVKVLLKILVSGVNIPEDTEVPESLKNSEVGDLLHSMIEQSLTNTCIKDKMEKLEKILETESHHYKVEIENKERQLQELESLNNTLQTEKSDREIRYTTTEETLQAQVNYLGEQNSQTEHKIVELNGIKEALEHERSELQRNFSNQTDVLDKTVQNCDNLEKKCKSVAEDLKKIEEQNKQLESENWSLQEKMIQKENELVELRQKSVRVEDEFQQKHNSECNLTSKLQAQIEENERTIKEMKHTISELNISVADSHKSDEEHSIKIKEREAENIKLSNKLTTFEKDLNEKNVILQTESNKLCTSLRDNASLEEKLKDLKEKQFDLEQQLANCVKENTNHQRQRQKALDKLEIERHTLKKHLEDALKDIESIKQQLTHTSAELDIAYTEKEKLDSEKNDLILRQDELDEKLKHSEDENEILTKEKIDLTNEMKEMTSLKLVLEKELDTFKDQVGNLHEKVECLQMEKQKGDNEKHDLELQIAELNKDLSLKTEEIFKAQESRENVEKELNELRLNFEEGKQSTESEKERLKIEHEKEVEVLKSELSSLQFQLSSEQIKFEQSLQTFSDQDSSISGMKEKQSKQEELIATLEQEMSEIKSNTSLKQSQQQQELEKLRLLISSIEEEKKDLTSKLQEVSQDLESQKSLVLSLQTKLKEGEDEKEKLCTGKDNEVGELKSDIQQLKKKIVKLTRDKDSLWQKTDQLSYEQKLQARDKWLDEKDITQCMQCRTDFSFTVRKHHCRICGRVFCYQCSDNWMQTAHSRLMNQSKKSRACRMCFEKTKQLEDDTLKSNNSENDFEDTVEIPKLHKKRGVMNESDSSAISDVTQTSDSQSDDTGSIVIPGQVASAITVSMVEGNITDEIKEKQKDDQFHLISDEEVSKSLTEPQISPLLSTDPNMTSSMTISTTDLEKGEVNSQNEILIKPGKTFSVPVMVDRFNTTLCWEFNSHPKDVVFGVHYQTMTGSSSEVLIPPCKVDSHKQYVKGELTAKQLGIYSLIFDNTYSRFTAKKIMYKLWSNKGK
ncbi:FYVE and coiled-coil domain-containing protein 1-like isoform X2 [Mytilus californianus]|uniref:FYVE and coiled-coil domain-containing protein 1-like isoform X2 n=1 Tax=Mytilus californianus TaxID=6549 RepID=UPI002247C36A|nr:FYVE and coiled-coil domain-containing protein 1-like isoform X2 [Mytilus californianus]